MTAAARHARHGAVTVAARQAMTMAGPCEPGDVLGVVDGDFAVVGDDLVRGRRRDVLDRLLGGGGELVTLVAGDRGRPDLAAGLRGVGARSSHPDVDVVVYDGGQERYPLLVAVEYRPIEQEHPRMISLDSPVAAVLGAKHSQKRKRIVEGLGLHDRRRPAAPLPAPLRRTRGAQRARASSRRASMLTVVGEVVRSEVKQPTPTGAPAAPAYRLEVVRRPTGARLQLTFFAKQPRLGRVARPQLAVGTRRAVPGKVGTFQRPVAADQPQMELFGAGERRRRATASADWTRSPRADPDLPADRGRRVLAPRSGRSPSPSTCSTTCPSSLPDGGARAEHDVLAARQALRLDPPPRRAGPGATGPRSGFRFDEALRHPDSCSPGAGRRCGRSARSRAPGGRAACSTAFDARLPFALTDGQREVGARDRGRPRPSRTRCTGCCRARSAPARRSSRCARCSQVVDSGGQAALLAPDRGARPAAPPLDHRDARRPRRGRHARRRRRGHPGRAAHRLA